MDEYRVIVREYLGIADEFLNGHKSIIASRLVAAHGEMVKGAPANNPSGTTSKVLLQDTIYGINHCIHLASSLAVLGGAGHLQSAVSYVQGNARFDQLDATTVLTIATLYYILREYIPRWSDDLSLFSKPQNIVADICRRFDMVNWMIGKDAMEALGIKYI